MRLDRIYLFLTTADPSFDATGLYQCLGVEPIDYGDSDMVGVISINAPLGSAKIETYPCAAKEDHAFHITLDFRQATATGDDDTDRVDLNKVIDCVLQSADDLSTIPVETGLLYPKSDYTSIVYDRRQSFSHEKIDDKIKLTGVDLDFTESDFPLSGARVSDRRRDILVVLRRRREFVIDSDHYNDLFNESEKLASTFVRHTVADISKPEEPTSNQPANDDE